VASSPKLGFTERFQSPLAALRFSEISVDNYANRNYTLFPARAAMRDASRSSRSVVRVAMGRGRRQVLAPDETSAADGEVVWSWRRDPGVYPRSPVAARQRGQKRPFPGESTK
jgi:hypothetical protein